MFENIKNIFKKTKKKELPKLSSKDAAKERLHLVLMQDRANVSADFLDLMRKEIIEVIKKYIDIDEKSMDVRLTTDTNEDGTQGAPALYANIPIINIKDETRKLSKTNQENKINVEPPKTEEENEHQKQEEKEESVESAEDKVKSEEASEKEKSEDEVEQEITETENANNPSEEISMDETIANKKENKKNIEEEKKNEK